MDRNLKNKKESENVFEIFRLREKDIPVECFDMKGICLCNCIPLVPKALVTVIV